MERNRRNLDDPNPNADVVSPQQPDTAEVQDRGGLTGGYGGGTGFGQDLNEVGGRSEDDGNTVSGTTMPNRERTSGTPDSGFSSAAGGSLTGSGLESGTDTSGGIAEGDLGTTSEAGNTP